MPLAQAQAYLKNLPTDITQAKKQTEKAKQDKMMREIMRQEYVGIFEGHIQTLMRTRAGIETAVAEERVTADELKAAKEAVGSFRVDRDAFTKALDVYAQSTAKTKGATS